MSILKVQQSPPRFPPNKKPMFILQTVSVQWTKRSRSAPLATIRNRLPRLLPLPDTVYFTDKRDGRKSRRRLFVLADGQTAQLRTNGRGCGFDDTYYTQHTYNLAYAKHIPREIFTQRRFDYCVSLENRLF